MKFHPASTTIADHAMLQNEYSASRQIGAVRIARTVLFFRAGLKTYYVPYEMVRQCFRRVYQVPVKMCCGRGEIEYEHLVISNGEKEIADIPLPGTKAAQELILLLKEKMPAADFRSPRERVEETVQSGQGEIAGEGV